MDAEKPPWEPCEWATCSVCGAARPTLLSCLGLVIGTCFAEGKGLAAIGSAVTFICTLLRSSSVATNTKKELLSSVTSLGMEYLSLQMIALLPALDTVLANMCNCWKCNDDYLHI